MTGCAAGAREAAVRDAFRRQRKWCEQLGSPFTALLCSVVAERLDRGSALGRRILDWPGDPDARSDALPLRLAGGLHGLVRRGRLPGLAALYPPARLPDAATLWGCIAAALREAEAELGPWLDGPPQTNEVARSAALMAGYLAVADATGLPLAVLELGASAGLNLLADRYLCRLGGREVGPSDSPVRLRPAWTGGDPPGEARILSRRGVDRDPPDPTRPADRERLCAYVWPDQAERLARVEAALAMAAADPPRVDRADAGDWLAERLAERTRDGIARVVSHSIAFQYFPADVQARIRREMEGAGRAATAQAPLAWLRFESDPEFDGKPSLRVRLWPDDRDRLLARVHPHGRSIDWLG